MKRALLLTALAFAASSAGADAHFVLVSPAASLEQNKLGDPQKIAPCGGVSANPARGTPPDPGVPTRAVTELKGGSTFRLVVNETIYHPGHYRVALARTAAGLPPDPVATTTETPKGRRSASAEIAKTPVPPVLLDGLFPHAERPTANWETDVAIPNVDCKDCVLQVIQFMVDHPGNREGGFSYYHCATVNITADASKPLDTRWK